MVQKQWVTILGQTYPFHGPVDYFSLQMLICLLQMAITSLQMAIKKENVWQMCILMDICIEKKLTCNGKRKKCTAIRHV